MKVYLLTTGDGSDGDAWHVLSIHATMSSAEAARAEYQQPRFRHDGSSYISYTNDIEEWGVEGACSSRGRPIDEKLRRLRACILDGSHEDAQEHLFDLLRGLRCKDTPDHELTPIGMERKSLWAIDMG
jgi:hypothetical protein